MKKTLPIVTDPNPILHKKADKIAQPLSKEIQELIPTMVETMRQADGLGLAAPQIGKSIRLCTIEEGGILYVLINPTITASSRTKIIMEEGCLSIPGIILNISRPEKVKVRYLDVTGKEGKIKATGLLARALQHEIDHLDGILMFDRAKKIKKSKTNSVKK